MDVSSNSWSQDAAHGVWQYVDEVLNYPELLNDLGFRDKSDIKYVVVVLLASDRIHPETGLDYLGPNWEKLERKHRMRLMAHRDGIVDDTFHRVLTLLEHEGYDVASTRAETMTKYQVIFLSRSREETQICIQRMDECGIALGEYNDFFLQRVGEYLVFGFNDNLSFYLVN